MKVLVFGATGRAGLSVLKFALADCHEVTAFVRTPANLGLKHERLRIVEGDVYQPETIKAAMLQGFDAVVGAIGGDVFKPSKLVTDGVQAIVLAMEQAGIPRYVGISGTAFLPHGILGAITLALLRMSPVGNAVRDHEGAYRIVTGFSLNWTLAACPYIKDGQHKGVYQLSPGWFPGGFKTISPQDVADFLVKELKSQRYSNQLVGIWY